MNRRHIYGLAFLASAAFFSSPSHASGVPSNSGPSSGIAASVKLTPTPAQVEGPYFLKNSPIRSNLVPQGMKGQVIKVSGTVRDTSGNLVGGATIHVWLADPAGVYDNQDAQGNPQAIPVSQQKLRGRIIADAQANYSFECLRPGNYEVSPNRMRPAHIHVRVEAAGYKTLITQLYFTDDQWNAHDLPGAGFFKPELLVPLQPATAVAGTPQNGTFNFVIQK